MRLLLLPILLAACAGIEPQTLTGRLLVRAAIDEAVRTTADATDVLCLAYERAVELAALEGFDAADLVADGDRAMWRSVEAACAPDDAPELVP